MNLSIGARVREERNRLEMSQEAFAALADASKRAQLKWEKDDSAPNAAVLAAWAEAGVDVLYILTGHRTAARPNNARTQIEDQLADIRRTIIDHSRERIPGEAEQETERRVLTEHANSLRAIMQYDEDFLTPAMKEEVGHLLDVVTNPAALALHRAADFVQMRGRRSEMKAMLAEYFGPNTPYQPRDAVLSLLSTIAIEYSVPVNLMVELAYEIQEDIASSAQKG